MNTIKTTFGNLHISSVSAVYVTPGTEIRPFIRKGIKYMRITSSFRHYLILATCQIIHCTRKVEISSRQIEEGPLSAQEWLEVRNDQKVWSYDGGQRYSTTLHAGEKVKVIAWGNPSSATLLAVM